MIEPQNTMLPLSAEPAPAEVPHGEAGFGEMLAQTLGMIPQLDQNAIQRIMGNGGEEQGQGPGDGLANGGAAADEQERHVAVARYITLPVDGTASVSAPIMVPRPPAGDVEIVDPVFPKEETPPVPIVTTATRRTTGMIPQESQPAVPSTPLPGDGIGKPVLAAEPDVVPAMPATSDGSVVAATSPEPAATAVAVPIPHEPAAGAQTQPGREPAPVAEPAPSPEPPPMTPVAPELPREGNPVRNGGGLPNAQPIVTEPGRIVEPIRVGPKPIEPVENRRLPVEPAPLAPAPRGDIEPSQIPTSSTPATAPSGQHTNISVDSPIEFAEPEVRISQAGPISMPQSTITVETGTVSTPNDITGAVVDAGPTQVAPVTSFATPVAPTQHSALAERVLQAVEMQANQPPPRTMVVDIPEIEGLRLVVSVRAGAEVHVVPSTASTASDGLQPFLEELQGVLENRGFVMTGDGRRRGNNPNQDERPEPPRAPRPSFRRPEPNDNDLRI